MQDVEGGRGEARILLCQQWAGSAGANCLTQHTPENLPHPRAAKIINGPFLWFSHFLFS